MRKTLNKVIKNSGIRYFHREKQPFHGMNCHHELKITTFNLFLSKMAVSRKIIWFVLIAKQTNYSPIAHNNSGRKPIH